MSKMIFGSECLCGHPPPTITGYGADDAEVLAVGIAPGRTEIKEGKPFQGPAGKRFDDVLRACGFDRSQVYCTNLICWYKDAPTFDEIAACWPRLLTEIEERKPRLILALGALASEWLTGYKVGKIRGGIIWGKDLAPTGKLREYGHRHVILNRTPDDKHIPEFIKLDKATATSILMTHRLNPKNPDPWLTVVGIPGAVGGEMFPDLHVMSTWHPAATLPGRNPALVGDLVRDFRKIPRFLDGDLAPIKFRQRVITDKAEAQRALYWLSGRIASLDVETTFDTPDAWGKLLCLAISTKLTHTASGVLRPNGPEYVSYWFRRELLDDLNWPGSRPTSGRRASARSPLPGVGARWGFHNGPFDRNVLRRELGVDLPIHWDSMYASYACDERPGYDRDDRASGTSASGAGRNKAIGPGYHNLDQLAREYVGAGFFKSDTEKWIGHDPDEFKLATQSDDGSFPIVPRNTVRWDMLRDRNCLDAAYTMALPDRLPPKTLSPAYKSILIPAANAYSDVQQTGILIDQERLRDLESVWGAERARMESKLIEWAGDLGYTNPPKRKRDLEGPEFNPASSQQLAKLLFGDKGSDFAGLGIKSKVLTKKGKKPSTSEEALLEISHPFVTELMRLRKYANTLKYLPILRKFLRPDGRVHPTFLPLVTGRYSAVDPPMQTFPQPYKLAADGVPELGALRSIIIPSPGMVLIAVDYEQIEIWMAALLSGDETMLADLREPFEGGKPNYHSRVTRNVLQCQEPIGSPRWETVRRGAKVFTFGIEFGEGAAGLAKSASQESGIPFTKSQAQKIINEWYGRYDTFAKWQRGQINLARKQGYLMNPFGSVRRFPFPDDAFKNQMVNSTIQGTASQHGTIAMVELVDPTYFQLATPTPPAFVNPEARPLSDIGGRVLLTIHDEILCEVPEYRVPESLQIIREAMEYPRVPEWPGMLTSSKMGTDWFSLK